MVRMVLLMVVSALGVVSQCAPIIAQAKLKDDPAKEEKPAASLKVGDLAPPFKVTKWLQEGAVRTFEPGKIYVVHFWAPWCGACCGNMPHLAELQAHYKDQGVTIIGFTSRNIRGVPDNTEEKVAAFVKKHGTALMYTFAYADDSTTTDAWLKAAPGRLLHIRRGQGRADRLCGPVLVPGFGPDQSHCQRRERESGRRRHGQGCGGVSNHVREPRP